MRYVALAHHIAVNLTVLCLPRFRPNGAHSWIAAIYEDLFSSSQIASFSRRGGMGAPISRG